MWSRDAERTLKVVVDGPDLIPERKTRGSAGLDLRVKEDVELVAFQVRVVGTGVRVAIPDGYVGLVFLRSSMALRDIQLANHVGVIDSDYRGEIMLPLQYVGPYRGCVLNRGERVAQLVIVPYLHVDVQVVDRLDETERGEGGFGSTGVQ